MPVQIALLRAINVGGRNRISMAELRELVETLGFTNVRTLLQSGNLVFKTGKGSSAAIERQLEVETKKRFSLEISYVVRTAAEWETIIAQNPFGEAAKRDPAHLCVMPLKDAPTPSAVNELQAAIQGRETVHALGKELYLVYPDGIGTSKLTNVLIERKLSTRGTARNWNTVLKLATLAAE
jgi:uncharacterized protein (DUF1697 family)